jgi:hypothetical protein
MLVVGLQTEEIAAQVKRADLPAAVGKNLERANPGQLRSF